MMSACPDENELGRFVEGLLANAEEARLQRHLEACPICFALVNEIARAFVTTGSGPEPSPLAPGRRVFGRYEVVSVLGQGGMGTVFEAKDAATDRRVAVKVLHYGPSNADARSRLQREARAMARLNHPNVVQVFDIGQDAGDTYMVSELVNGTTLDRWIEEDRPSSPRILRAFVGIAHGIEAAHAVGLVHRDVKPRNVLIDRTGTPRVTDLGLARLGHRTLSESLSESANLDRQSSVTLAPRGAVVGTPAYMSPEQLRGDPASPASDQFSFCVMLYEALCGRRPFSGKSVAALLDSTMRGPAPWPHTTKASRTIRRAVQRGLRPDQDRRWPSMADLAAVLDREARGRMNRFPLLAAALGIAVLAVGMTIDDAPTGCPDQPGIDVDWTDDARAQLRETFTASDLRSPEEQWPAVEHKLDDYVAHWVEAQAQVCSRPTEPELMSDSIACLQRGRTAFVSTIQAMRRDTASLARASAAVSQLELPSKCLERAPAAQTSDPHKAALDKALRGRLVAVDVLLRVGQHAEAYAEAHRLVEDARQGNLTLREGQAYLRAASSLEELGRYPEAVDAGQAAMFAAIETGDDELLLESSSSLTFLAARLDLREAGETWARQADAASIRLGRPPLLEAKRLHHTGTFLLQTGRPSAGRDLLVRAAETRLETLGPLHPDYATALSNLSLAEGELGDLAEHRAHAVQALEIRRESLGPDHPDLAAALNNLGVSYYDEGKLLEARPLFVEALEIRQRILEPGHPMITTCTANLGNIAFSLGQFEEAASRFEDARQDFERSLGADHPKVGHMLAANSRALSRLGRFDEAIAQAQRAVTAMAGARGSEDTAVIEAYHALGFALGASGRLAEAQAAYREAGDVGRRILPAGHRLLAESSHMLGVFLYSEGRVEEAVPHFESALESYEAILGPNGTEVANLHTAIGASLADLGEIDRGLEHLEKALSITESKPGMPDDLAATRAYLAQNILRAHRDRKPDRERAIHLLEQARAHYVSAGERSVSDLAEIEQMLAPYRGRNIAD